MILITAVGLAIRALLRNRLRTLLTILGIMIGIAAVICTVALGEGSAAQIQQQMLNLGDNFILEAFSSNGSGTLSIIKENSPTSFVVEQELKTVSGAKTMTIDAKMNHVLLIAGEYGPAPAPTTPPPTPPAGGRGRGNRGPMLGFSILVVGK